MTILVEKIEPITIGGAGYGNTYRFKVTRGTLTTLSSCERDVAYGYQLANMPVPEEFQGPYDGYGRKIEAQ